MVNTIGPLLIGDRPLPQSLQAERAVLSCLLQDPDGTMDDVFARIITDDYFFSPAHRHIFNTLKELRGEMPANRVDMVILQDRLERKGLLESAGREEYISQVFGTVPTTANVDKYVTCVVDTHILRRLIETSAETVNRCFEAGDDLETAIDLIERDILGVTKLRIFGNEFRSMKDLLKDALDHLEKVANRDPSVVGVPTLYHDLDKLITGLRPGDMIVLAARPSIGKTTIALNVAQNVARQGFGVGIFSLEMGAAQLAMRFLCAEAKFSMVDVRDGKLTNATFAGPIMAACDTLSKMPIYIDDTPQISALEMRQKARRMRHEHDVRFIVVDYLQLMRPTGGGKNSNREQDVARLSGDIKALAKELGVPIMLLAQLNRQAEQGGKPKLSHLRESGAIEQDADVVLLLHRERDIAISGGADGDAASDAPPGGLDSDLIVAKNRNGPTGELKLWFFPAYTRFENQARVADDNVPRPGGHRQAGPNF